MVTSGYSTQTWHDMRLKWDPMQHKNITKVRVKARLLASDIWKPNVILYNSDDGEFKSYIQGKNIF